MPKCVAAGCRNSTVTGSVRYFPRDPERRRVWAANVGKGNWVPTENSCLCDDHFDAEQWEKLRVDGKKRLKCNAVPTIFANFTYRNNNQMNSMPITQQNATIVAPAHHPSVSIAPIRNAKILPKKQGIFQKILATPQPIKDQALVERSTKGQFGWEIIEEVHIPYIFRGEDKLTSTRILEAFILKKYDLILHPTIYSCVTIPCWLMLSPEIRLFNEINTYHCDGLYGPIPFSSSDLMIKLTDAQEFTKFLAVAISKLKMANPSNRCGFLKLNKEAVVPYVMVEKEPYLPIFYFEGEVENINTNSIQISGWDVTYLKFCCKVQQIKESLYNKPVHDVVKLSEIKKHFPSNATFETFWPSAVANEFLLNQSH